MTQVKINFTKSQDKTVLILFFLTAAWLFFFSIAVCLQVCLCVYQWTKIQLNNVDAVLHTSLACTRSLPLLKAILVC